MFFFPRKHIFPILYEDFRLIIFTAQYFLVTLPRFKDVFLFRTKTALTVECATYKNKKV